MPSRLCYGGRIEKDAVLEITFDLLHCARYRASLGGLDLSDHDGTDPPSLRTQCRSPERSIAMDLFVLATFPSTASDGFSWNGATVSNRDSPEHQVVACVREAVAGSFQNAFALS